MISVVKQIMIVAMVIVSPCLAAEKVATTALHQAALRGETESVSRLISEGVDVDAKNLYGITPLSIACEYGNSAIVELLLDAGADANQTIAGGETALMTSCRTGDVGIVAALIKHGAAIEAKNKSGQTALMWAADEGNIEAIDVLIEAGAKIDSKTKQGFTAMMFASREGRIDTALRLIEAGADVNDVMNPPNSSGRNPRERTSALMLAVESGHFELALRLVEAGADPNDQRSGYAPLHAVTWVRKTERGDNVEGDPSPRGSGRVTSLQFVRRLIGAGADVNLQLLKGKGGRAELNMRGATPFLLASKTADLPLMEVLLELGADPLVTNADDSDALMAVAGLGVKAVGEEAGTEPEVIAVIDRLIQLGLDPNRVNKDGETAMHGIAYRNYPSAVASLAQHGAQASVWNRKDKYGTTPIMIASGKRPGSFKPSPETIAALEAAMIAQPQK